MFKLQGQTLAPGERFTPDSMSLNLAERESTASMKIGDGAPAIAVGDWLIDNTEPGAGIVWRAKTVDQDYGNQARTVTLEHIISTLKDTIMFGEVTPADMSGTTGATECTAEEAAEYILSKTNLWTLGGIDYNVSAPFNFNGDSLFDALETVCSALEDSCWEYDLTEIPFKLYIREKSEATACEMRMSRNISSVRKTIDRSRMYTRLYPIGQNNIHITGDYISRNENTWGIICKTETENSKKTEAELLAWATERLRRHSDPAVTITISGVDMSAATGESLDHIRIGTVCRVPLPEFNTTMAERVVKLAYRDKINEPENITVTLSNTMEDVATIINNQSKSGGRSGRAAAKKEGEDHAWFIDTESHVGMVAEAIIGQGPSGVDWSRVASIIVDGYGIHERVMATEDEIITMKAEIETTESHWRAQFDNMVDSLRGEVEISASGLRAEFIAGMSSLRGEFEVTASHMRADFTDEVNSLRGEFEVSASGLRAEFVAGMSSLRGEFEVSASGLRAEFEDATSSLRTDIQVQAGRINLVVEGEGSSASIKLSAIVDGINQSQLELNADRVVIGSGSNKKKVKVYVDGEITATEAQITNLKTGTTKATLINADAFNGDAVTGGIVYATTQLSIGSNSSGGSGSLYFRGTQFYNQALTLGTNGSIAEGHFLGNSSTTLNIDHYHKIIAEEGTGADAGKIILTLSDPVATSDTANHITNFNIAATTTYINGVAAAKNSVKVKAFTADARQQTLNDHRTFTYTTDATNPVSGAAQEDTWYLAGGTNFSNNKTNVYLRYGTSSGTAYAQLEVDATTLVRDARRAGREDVTLNEATWNAVTGNLPDHRTFSVKTSGRTDSSGTAADLTESKTLYVTQGSWNASAKTLTVSMKLGSSSGTELAKTTVDASTIYEAGQNAVSVSQAFAKSGDSVDDTNTETLTTSAPAPWAKSYTYTIAENGWLYDSGTGKYTNIIRVRSKASDASGNGTMRLKLIADASDAITAATPAIQNAVKVQAPVWDKAGSQYVDDSNIMTITTNAPSPDSGTGREFEFLMSADGWDNGTNTIRVRRRTNGSTSGGTLTLKMDITAPPDPHTNSITLTRYRAGAVESVIPGQLYRYESDGHYHAIGYSDSRWYMVRNSDALGSSKTVFW